MPEPTYDNVAPLVASQEVTGNYVRVVFQCPVSGEQVAGSGNAAAATQGDLIKKEIKQSVWRNMRWSIASTVRSLFGYNAGGMVAGAVTDIAMTPGGVRAEHMSKDELKLAIVEAFRQVSSRFAWDATNERWVSAKTLRELQAEFTVYTQQVQITKAWDKAALARMLAEIASADGELGDEERELFHAFAGGDGVPSLDELLERPPITDADLEEVSDEARQAIWLIAAAMAATDKELAEAELELLTRWADAFGIPAAEQHKGIAIAREWVIDQALEASYSDGKLDKAENAEIRRFAQALGVPDARVDRLDARTRKRRGIF